MEGAFVPLGWTWSAVWQRKFHVITMELRSVVPFAVFIRNNASANYLDAPVPGAVTRRHLGVKLANC
jgi:hypothetical protein